jgi:hypothetical protein
MVPFSDVYRSGLFLPFIKLKPDSTGGAVNAVRALNELQTLWLDASCVNLRTTYFGRIACNGLVKGLSLNWALAKWQKL